MKNPLVQAQKWFALRGKKRSPLWPRTRKVHLAAEPWCRACGALVALEVHHVKPFHIAPWLENEPSNLLTLCENVGKQCHLRVGHLGNWQHINTEARNQANWPKP